MGLSKMIQTQGSPEWLEARKGFITATDSSIIMGLNPFKTPLQLWRQKMDLDPPEVENHRMREGTRLEPLARDWLKEQGIYCEPKVVFKDFMMASLDGLSEDGTFVVEIKCGEKAYACAEQGIIKSYYNCQMQHQLHCADVDEALYVAYNGKDGIIIPVERDQKFIDEMIPILKEFYLCLISYTEPLHIVYSS